MSKKLLEKFVSSKVGQVVLGTVAAGVVGTVGGVLAKGWVGKKVAARELKRVQEAAEKERQRLAAEAEKERQRLAAIAEQERQRAAALVEKERQRTAALAAEAQRKAGRRAALESKVGVALNHAFQRLGLNLRAEVSPAAAEPETKAK